MEGFQMIGMNLCGGKRLCGVGMLWIRGLVFWPFGTALMLLRPFVLEPHFDASLNLSRFVARKIWRGRGVSPRRGKAHRLQRRESLRCLLMLMDSTFDLLQTAIN
jgi:hypothetical protein